MSSTTASSAPTGRAGASTAKPLFRRYGRKVIYAYDYDTATGDVRKRTSVPSREPADGLPDGATVDAEGCVWSCEVYSGSLIRFDPNGVVDRIVGLPV